MASDRLPLGKIADSFADDRKTEQGRGTPELPSGPPPARPTPIFDAGQTPKPVQPGALPYGVSESKRGHQ